MRILPALLTLTLLVPAVPAQEKPPSDLLRKVDELLKRETERSRAELLDLVRSELRGAPQAAPPAAAPSLPGTVKAKGLVTVDLLKKHAMFLAGDDLEGRCAGYPGNDKAAEYLADVFKGIGLKPAGDNGTYFQKFRLGGKDTRNVMATVEGSDPQLKGEVVVVGAHFDHVGTADQRDYGRMGKSGDDTIWNGADDNASGTTCMLAIAKAFGEGGLAPRRTVLFMGFSGEEAGLVGSRWYVNHPVVPIEKHAFMLNLDMVGRNPQKAIELQGVGSADGGVLKKLAEAAVASSGLKAKLADGVTLIGGDSDHSSFADKKVPYAFFFSGFHADYHRPTDHPEKLAYDNMVKVAHTSVDLLLGMADLEERPRYAGRTRVVPGMPDLRDPSAPPARRLGVTVQELDDAECDALKLPAGQGALRVENLQSGGAAETAGVKNGDVVLSVAGTPLPRGGTRDDLRKILTTQVKPKEDVEIVVLRDGGRVALKAKWNE